MTQQLAADLAEYSDAELREFYVNAAPEADEWRAILETEAQRRDDADAAAKTAPPVKAGRAPGLAERTEWYNAAHAQYLRAEADCSYLLSAEGEKRIGDPMVLWSQPEKFARAMASEQLREWWDANGRLTYAAWKQGHTGEYTAWREQRDRAAYPAEQEEEETMGVGHLFLRGAEMAARSYGSGPQSSSRAAEAAARTEALRQRRDSARALRALTEAAAQPAYVPGSGLAVVDNTGVVVAKPPHIDGGRVFRYIYTFLKRFAVWGSEAEIVAAALWIMQTHARDDDGVPVWSYCPRFAVVGPSGSGKSWKSRLIGKLSYKGEILIEPTKPAFIDMCAENNTVILTEADEAFRSPGRSRGIVAVANASYEPDRKHSRKQGGVAVKIPLFCHLVLDGIDEVLLNPNRPDLYPLMSRSLAVRSRKAPDGYRPPRFDAKARGMAGELAMLASAWAAQEVAAGMADTVPEVPDDLGNRPYALWEPLFIVAQHADDSRDEEGNLLADGPIAAACRDACEYLEAGQGLPEPAAAEGESELDRQMAAWAEAF